MAYMCTKFSGKECDACGDCKPSKSPETGVTITATIELKFTAYGLIEEALRGKRIEEVQEIAEEIVDSIINRQGLYDMTVESVNCELAE